MGVTSYYSFGGEIIGEETGGVRRDYLTDALGSVTATVTDAGVVENTYRYKPYGETLAKTGVGNDPKFLWNGKWGYKSVNSRVKYIRARFYSLSLSKWISKDIFWQIESTYGYAENNPIIFYDYNGLFIQKQKKPFVSMNQKIPYPGYIPKPYPGNEKERQKVCKYAIDHNVDHGNDQDSGYGGNFCWNGKIYPCVHYQGGSDCVKKCVLAHELDHWFRNKEKQMYICPEKQEACYVDAAPGLPEKDPYWQDRDECKAYLVTADCFSKCCANSSGGDCFDAFQLTCERISQHCGVITPSIGAPPYIVEACKKKGRTI